MRKIINVILAIALFVACTDFANAQYITVTVAGLGIPGYSGDGGSARQAKIKSPKDACIDASNNIYFVDAGNSVIRKVSASTGVITTVAGGGVSYADGVPATTASILGLSKIAIDAAGNLYISSSNKVRMISTAGIISTIAGTGVTGFNGDGIPATSAQLNTPSGVCVDAAGNIYIADVNNNRIRKVTVSTGLISSIALSLSNVNYICMDSSGNLFYANYTTISKIAVGTGVVSVVSSGGSYGGISGICVDKNGSYIYFDDISCGCHRVVVATGATTIIANVGGDTYNGDGGNSLLINFNAPTGLCMDAVGNIYVADRDNNRIRKVAFVTHAPAFVYGKGQITNACPGAVTNTYSQLAVTDIDTLQNELWTTLTSPVHGVLAGFPATALSGGRSGLSVPSGVYYTSSATYSGIDSFQVQVSDGTFADTMTIYLNVNSGNPPDASFIYNPACDSIPEDTTYTSDPQKRFQVCIGHQLQLAVVTPGGTWSLDNVGASTISSSGIITGVSAGTVNVTYSITNGCGSSYATQQVTIINCGTSAVGSMDQRGILIFPNPASQVLNIEWPEQMGERADVIITDVMGRVVLNSELENINNSGTEQMDISMLNDGVYIVKVNSGSAHFISKVVISGK